MPKVVDFIPPPELKGVHLRLMPHAVRPMLRLAQDMFDRFMRAFGGRVVFIHGYGFLGGGGGEPTAQLEPSPYSDARESWEKHYRPMAEEICLFLREKDYRHLSTPELAEALSGFFDDAGRVFACTMAPLMGVVTDLAGLVAFCQELFGEDGAREALIMLEGFENDSASTALQLEPLAAMAQDSERLLTAVRSADLEAITAAPGGTEFVGLFNEYLEEFGHGSQTWWEIQDPTWAEDPSVPLGLIARWAASPLLTPTAAHETAVSRRDAAIARTEGKISDDASRKRFHELLGTAHDYVSVVEGRAHWQQNAVGAVRAPCVALGARLVAAGALTDSGDVFLFTLDELCEIAADGPAAAAAATRAGERRAELASWGRLSPPMTLGQAPEGGPPGPPIMAMMFGGPPPPSDDPSVIKGVGASPGIVDGTARVIRTMADADRLEQGDILVCPFTAPSWTPLFVTVGAVVTNQGGMLAHAAIEAREYGLPCIVGTQDGTDQIPDGARVTVDGTAGTVHVHPD